MDWETLPMKQEKPSVIANLNSSAHRDREGQSQQEGKIGRCPVKERQNHIAVESSLLEQRGWFCKAMPTRKYVWGHISCNQTTAEQGPQQILVHKVLTIKQWSRSPGAYIPVRMFEHTVCPSVFHPSICPSLHPSIHPVIHSFINFQIK